MRIASLLLLAAAACAADGSVQWSDGRVEEGAVTLAQDLRFHDGAVLHTLARARVREVRLAPEREEMAASWRFPEPGKARKELVGRPYPVRALGATVVLDDGTVMKGHLHTTVAYLTRAGEESPSKVMIAAKQQGTSDQTLMDLVYPVRVVLPAEAAAGVPRRLLLPVSAVGAVDEVALLAGTGLVRLAATQGREGWTLPAGVELPAVVAARGPAGLTVSWPAGDDAELRRRLEPPLAAVPDYMDGRQLLAAWQPEGGEVILSLLLLTRVGSTTGEKAAKPWRLEVWRWKPDPVDPAHWLVAAHGYLLRGTGAAPAVTVEHAWWPLRATAAGFEVGHE